MAIPIESLKREHRAIEAVIRSLRDTASRVGAGDPISPDTLDLYVDFIRNFADGSHHQKEEKILFPAMNAAGFPSDVGPVACMLGEHEQGRGFVRRMFAAIAGLREGKAEARSEFQVAANGYCNLLTDHIQKEDTILFRMAETIVGEERLSALIPQFEAVERAHGAEYLSYQEWAYSLETAPVAG
jgi:hemerythrin-like domain-containing protein